MAVKAKRVKEKIKETLNEPLSSEELRLVDETERYIDDLIIDESKTNFNDYFRVDLLYFNFTYHPTLKEEINIKFHDKRKEKMQQELQRRFRAAGWKTKIEIADNSYNEPNFESPDYWVLRA